MVIISLKFFTNQEQIIESEKVRKIMGVDISESLISIGASLHLYIHSRLQSEQKCNLASKPKAKIKHFFNGAAMKKIFF